MRPEGFSQYNPSDPIRNRPRHLPACSAVPQSTAPPYNPLVNRKYKQRISKNIMQLLSKGDFPTEALEKKFKLMKKANSHRKSGKDVLYTATQAFTEIPRKK